MAQELTSLKEPNNNFLFKDLNHSYSYKLQTSTTTPQLAINNDIIIAYSCEKQTARLHTIRSYQHLAILLGHCHKTISMLLQSY